MLVDEELREKNMERDARVVLYISGKVRREIFWHRKHYVVMGHKMKRTE